MRWLRKALSGKRSSNHLSSRAQPSTRQFVRPVFDLLEDRVLPTISFSNGLLLLGGDTNTTNQNDRFVLIRDGMNPTLVNAFVNPTPMSIPFQVALASINKIAVYGAGGNNVLIVDSSNGLISDPQGIDWNSADPNPAASFDENAAPQGEDGFNQTILFQLPGANAPTLTTDVYSVGLNPGDGTSVVTDSQGNKQTVNFFEVSPTFDSLPAPTLTVNGTNANNAINYKIGRSSMVPTPDPAWGEVSVDNQEPMEFTEKDNLVINGLAGDDTINLNNPNAPAGSMAATTLATITVNGGDPTASDTLIANGTTGTDTINFAPTAPDAGSITDAGPVPITFTTTEKVVINGQGGDDLLTYTSPANGAAGSNLLFVPGATPDAGTVTGGQFGGTPLVPMAFTNLGAAGIFTFATGNAGRTDTLEVDGTEDSDIFNVSSAGVVQLQKIVTGGPAKTTIPISTPGINQLRLSGLNGDDIFNLRGTLPYESTVVDGGDPSASDILDLSNPSASVVVNLADSSASAPTTIVGYGGVVTISGVEVVNLNAATDGGGEPLTVNGTSKNDNITYTPSGASAGTFTNTGLNTVFNFTGVTGTFLVTGGTGGNADQVTVVGTAARDLFEIDQAGRTAQVLANNVTAYKTVTLDPTIAVLSALGETGENTFQIIPGAGLVAAPQDNLLINVDGGANGQSNALVLGTTFGATPGILPATSFVVINKLPIPNSGAVRVFQSAVANPDINYKNVQVLAPNVSNTVNGQGLNPNLLVMGPDVYDPNFTEGTSAFIGSGSTLQIQNASIFPNSSEFPGVPANQDWYRVVAQTTGTLDFQVYFRAFNPALLPGGGILTAEVRDVNGNIVGTSGGAFGALLVSVSTPAAGARVRIPAVAGQSYFLHVFGAANNVVNGYNATIIDTAPPVPFNLQLSRSVPSTIAGAPDTGDLPSTAVNSDSGRSQFDNVTNINMPTIYLRVADGILLNDLPGNGTTNTPPIGVIPIPFSTAGVSAGYRVAIFDGSNAQTPVGFATPVPGFPGLYQFTFTTALADGLHHINARVQMVDPSTPTETGFGDNSVISLDITIDTAPPPVFFGPVFGTNGNGLTPGSDSGIIGDPADAATLTDRITNVTNPIFTGSAEANAIVRLFVLDKNGNRVFIGQAQAIPIDGTNAFPNGTWTIQSVVNFDDPAVFNFDGTRTILATAEDLAGNVSQPVTMLVFIDTQGPQVTNVQVTGSPQFNLFGTKGGSFNVPPPVGGPTPVVKGLTISFVDNPARDTVNFPNDPALVQDLAMEPGAIELRGDRVGLVAISQVIVTNNPLVNGQPATATVQIVFAKPLADDHYTLTLHKENFVDPAGNELAGFSNAAQPINNPTFPSTAQASDFIAAFTVNSHPHIGTWWSGNAYLDINGNGIFDPGAPGDPNKDLVFNFALLSDYIFAGNFARPGTIANGFSKLGAYGRVNGVYRFEIDFTGNGAEAGKLPQDTTGIFNQIWQVNGLPVAGHFDAAASGDQIGVFDGTSWFLDTDGDNVLGPGDTIITDGLRGEPIVGDFDGSGHFELATYQPDNKIFQFDLNPLGPGPHNIVTINFGFPGVGARPVAADLNGDGITDIGLFVPGQQGSTPDVTVDWYWLQSTGTPIVGTVNTLNHAFSPTPLGNDQFFQFGNSQALPLVGIWDPPVDTSIVDPFATTTATATAAHTTDWWVGLSTTTGLANIDATQWNPSAGWHDVMTADFNGDGKADIAARDNSGTWWVAISTGSTFLTEKWGQWYEGAGWQDVQVGDFNGDGLPDIIGMTASGQWWLAINQGGSFATIPYGQWWAGAGWQHVVVGHFTSATRDDVAGMSASGQWWLGANNGSQFVNELGTTWAASAGWRDIKVGDFTGDGKDDILGRTAAGEWWLAVSTGHGFINERWGQWYEAAGWNDVMVGDFNHDGKLDVIGRTNAGQWWLAENTGSGFINLLWGQWSPLAGWHDVLKGDFNGDGFPDLLGRTSDGHWWLAVDTKNGFINVPWGQWYEGAKWQNVLAADFNGDGRTDVFGRAS
jgi:hypothetical protein